MTTPAHRITAERTARVVAVEDGVAWLEAEVQAGCSSCGMVRLCTAGRRRGAEGRTPFAAVDPLGTGPGERVVVGMPAGALIRAAVTAYAIPLAAMVAGAVGGEALVGGDTGALAGAVAGLCAGVVWARHDAAAITVDDRLAPVCLRRVAAEPSNAGMKLK